jgi:uncharacterized membrane protein
MDHRHGGGFGRGGFSPLPDPYWAQHHGDHHVLGWLLFFFLLALIVALVVWVVLRLAGRGFGPPRQLVVAGGPPVDDALRAVRMRYAQGEIDRKAFLRLSSDLGGTAEPAADAPTLAE